MIRLASLRFMRSGFSPVPRVRPGHGLLLIVLALWLGLMVAGPDTAQAQPPLEVEVTGVDGERLEAALASLTLVDQRGHPLLTDSIVQRLHRQAPEELRAAMQPFGHYSATVEGELIREDAGWLARYVIDPGPLTRVRDVDVRLAGVGAADPDMVRWQRGFPLSRGDALEHRPYEAAKTRLLRIARDKGFFDGRFTRQELRVDPLEREADIVLHFDSGPRHTIGEIRWIQSEEAYDISFLDGFLPFFPGDLYREEELLLLESDLIGSDYFERVEARPVIEEAANGEVPIEIDVVPRTPRRYSFGLGFGTDTGARARTGVEWRRLNSVGHRAEAGLGVSQVRSQADFGYRIPFDRPATDALNLRTQFVDEDTDVRVRRTALVGADIERKPGLWTRSYGIGLQRERFQLGTRPTERSTLLIPRAGLRRLSSDDPLRPQRAWRLAGEVRGSFEEVVSSSRFLQAHGSARLVRGLGPGRVLFRGEVGTTQIGKVTDLPASLRFFTGGDSSVRGYKFETIAPRDPDGTLIGGRHLVVGSVEYEYPVSDLWGVAAFIDAGDASDDMSFDIKRGAGLGLRFFLPFATVRVDAAAALDREGTPWRLHITVGPDL